MKLALAATPIALCVGIGVAAAQRNPPVPPATLPIGLGIAIVRPLAGSVLHFYPQPGVGQEPGDFAPVDTVRFTSDPSSVDIAEAPPWLVPERLKMDYQIFHFRVLTLGTRWIEVIGNMPTGDSWWVDRSQIEFRAWPEFFLNVFSVEALNSETNPIRIRPLDASPIRSTARASVRVLAVQGEWLKVATGDLADRMPPEGWMRWRRGERLLVTYNPLS